MRYTGAMRTVTLYRQARVDGGVRTGAEVDGRTVFMHFVPGDDDEDSALLWFIDVQISADNVPSRLELLQQWLVQHDGPVRAVLQEMADDLSLGIDTDGWPFSRSKQFGALLVKVSCSAVRRLESREIALHLRDIAAHWQSYTSQLEAVPV